jgi:peptide subunit release factor 1 (eRF1)
MSFDLPPGELSSEALTNAFETARVSRQVQEKVRGLLDTCDAGRFASGAVTEEEKDRLTTRAKEVFREIERSAK